MPEGVLQNIFRATLGFPEEFAMQGRAVRRAERALALSATSRRLARVFQGMVRVLHLDACEHVHLDYALELACLVRKVGSHVRDLSLKWFEEADLRPVFQFVESRMPELSSLTLHGMKHWVYSPSLIRMLHAVGPKLKRLSLVSLVWLENRSQSDTAEEILGVVAERCSQLEELKLGHVSALSHDALGKAWSTLGKTLLEVELVNITHSTFGDRTLKDLTHRCSSLRSLNIHGMGGVTRHGLRDACLALACTLREVCIEARYLDMASVHDQDVVTIVENCDKLESVCFTKPRVNNDFHAVDDLTLRSVYSTYNSLGRNLREISMCGLADFTDEYLVELADKCPQLELVGLRSCESITSAGVSILAEKLGSSLRSIDISGSRGIDDDGLYAISRYCGGRIELLWIANLPLVTMGGVLVMLRGLGKGLKDLNLSKNSGLDSFRLASAVRQYCCGRRLESLIIDNIRGYDCHFEVARELQELEEEFDERFAWELERVRQACKNVIIIVEEDALDMGGGEQEGGEAEEGGEQDGGEEDEAEEGGALAMAMANMFEGMLAMHQGNPEGDEEFD